MKSFKQSIPKKGDVFVVKGKVYPQYAINRVVGDSVEYTMHTASGGKQHKMKISMFNRIKDLVKK
jgi:hypothetical protein